MNWNIIAFWIMVIGAINWGLVGLFHVDVVAELFDGKDSVIARIVYILIGISGLYMISRRPR